MTAHLSVAPDLASIREIGPWVRDCVDRQIVDATIDVADFTMKTELALQEVAANIVNHGHAHIEPGEGEPIDLTLDFVDGGLRIVIHDRGVEYEPAAQPVPDDGVPQVHGYGLMIVRQLTRRFEYARLDDINETTLEFDLPTASSSA